jgi:acetoin utilization deacetylase AcuC-like enzyme
LILVSVGFDAYWADPLAGMRLTLNGYSHLAGEVMRMARRLCDGKVVFVLEGGYHRDALSYGVSNVARVLLGDPPHDAPGAPPAMRREPDITALLAQLHKVHQL